VEEEVKGLLAISKVIDSVTEFFGRAAQWIVPLVIVIGFINVLMRKLNEWLGGRDLYGELTAAVSGSAVSQNQVTEVQWYLFAIMFCLSFAYILRHGVNVRVDFLYAKWGFRQRAVVDIAGTLLFLIPFCILGIFTSVPFVAFAWGCFSSEQPAQFAAFLQNLTCTSEPEIGPDPGSLNRAWIKSFLIVGFTLLLLQAVSQLIKYVAIATGRLDPPDEESTGQMPTHEITEVEERMRKALKS
jgi:TRAP-type mannitol/chloroaromatic compound transport system permease small subunit